MLMSLEDTHQFRIRYQNLIITTIIISYGKQTCKLFKSW